MPIRVQRRRVKGWRMPENTIYVGRPTRWGNPFRIGEDGLNTIEEVLERYEEGIDGVISTGLLDIEELRGKNLACFCALDKPCHADVLLKLANEH